MPSFGSAMPLHRQRRPDATMENRQPAQPQQQLRVRRELQVRRSLGRADVDVRLIEAVEEDEGIGPCLVESMRDVRKCGEEG